MARLVRRVPAPTLLVTVAGLAVLMVPLAGLPLDTGNPKALPESSNTRQLAAAIAANFPQLSGPDAIVLVAHTSPGNAALARFPDEVAAVSGVASVSPDASGHGLSVVLAIPAHPTSSAQTADAVRKIRAIRPGFEVLVTGDAARLVDYHDELAARLPWAGGIVTVATLLLLLLLFTGSVLIPVKAVVASLLSIGATLGAVVWVFQDGHGVGLLNASRMGGIDLTVPVVVAAIAFGLSTDYEVFVISRIRDRWAAGAEPGDAIVDGLRRSGGIITAAALLLGVAFAGFLTGGFTPIKEVGLGLVLAVALDATIVRMLMVPATLALLGRAAWAGPKILRGMRRGPAGTGSTRTVARVEA